MNTEVPQCFCLCEGDMSRGMLCSALQTPAIKENESMASINMYNVIASAVCLSDMVLVTLGSMSTMFR